MRLFLVLTVAALLAFSASRSISHAGPIGVVFAKYVEIDAAGKTMTERFRGGERASVQVIGNDKERPTTLHVTVHDDKGVLIAEAKGKEMPAADIVALTWYPPRDGEYKVTIRNLESSKARYFVALR